MKKILVILIFIFSSCGYQPIYIKNNLKNVEFYKINLEGENKINTQIINSLSIKENSTNKDLSELSLISSYKIEEISKNSKGQTQSYRSSIVVNMSIIKNKELKKSKIFSGEFTYNKKDNKFELIEYQENIKNELINSVIEDMILFLNIE